MPQEVPQFALGALVEKVGGDYTYEGEVVGVVHKLKGQVRYVVEDARGMLFIFNGAGLKHRAHAQPRDRETLHNCPTCEGSGIISKSIQRRIKLQNGEAP